MQYHEWPLGKEDSKLSLCASLHRRRCNVELLSPSFGSESHCTNILNISVTPSAPSWPWMPQSVA